MFVPMKTRPKEPDPISGPRRNLPPTRSSMTTEEDNKLHFRGLVRFLNSSVKVLVKFGFGCAGLDVCR